MLNKKLLALPIAALAVITPLAAQVSASEITSNLKDRGARQDISVDKQETDTQLIITLTAETEEALEKIQSSDKADKFGEALISQELTENGVILTVDKETFEEIKPEKRQKQGKHKQPENIETSRQETDTELIITLTAETEEALEQIQSSDRAETKFGEALVSKELTETGAILTIDKSQLEDRVFQKRNKVQN